MHKRCNESGGRTALHRSGLFLLTIRRTGARPYAGKRHIDMFNPVRRQCVDHGVYNRRWGADRPLLRLPMQRICCAGTSRRRKRILGRCPLGAGCNPSDWLTAVDRSRDHRRTTPARLSQPLTNTPMDLSFQQQRIDDFPEIIDHCVIEQFDHAVSGSFSSQIWVPLGWLPVLARRFPLHQNSSVAGCGRHANLLETGAAIGSDNLKAPVFGADICGRSLQQVCGLESGNSIVSPMRH